MKKTNLSHLHRSGSLWSVFLVMLSLLTACNSVDPNSPDSNPDWSTTLTYSGGIAGLMRSITIDDTGLVVFNDNRTKSKIEKKIEPDQLQLYANLVKILSGRETANNRNKQCRDCITYSLVVIYGAKSTRRVTDDLSLKNSDAKELISKLKTLASELSRTK